MMHRALWLAGLLALVGCDDGGGEEPTPNPDGTFSMDGAVVVDRGAAADVGPAADRGLDLDRGSIADGAGPEPADGGRALDAATDGAVDAFFSPAAGADFTAYFHGGAGPGWPEPWVVAGGVQSATVEDGMGCLVPGLSNYSLARMFAPLDVESAEVTFSLRFSDVAHQGVGFYLRANGGYLRETEPRGAGYGVFIEGFRQAPGIGVWREVDGEEQDIRINFDPAFALRDGVRYRVRFRATRRDATTDLRAKIWPAAEPEPRGWHVEAQDATPELQGPASGIVVDSWNDWNPADPGPAERGATCIDDVVIYTMDNPLDGIRAAEPIAEGYQFTEGPAWDVANGRLLFTDIPGDTIHAWSPGEAAAPLITPSGNANGLALTPDGELIVCEHAGRVVRYDDPDAAPIPLATMFDGQPLHSPNDVAVRSTGTIYFTDPPYGRPGARPGPLPFLGVYRLRPGRALEVMYRAGLDERPNGIAFSAGEHQLFVTDTQRGTLTAWVSLPDQLSNRRVLAENLPFADGMAVAPDGTLFVTTGRGVVVLDGNGNEWGVIEVPRQPSNCTLAPDGTLYITARETVYRVRTSAPGLRSR